MSALAKLLPAPPPPAPVPSPLIRVANGPAAPAVPQPGVGPGVPETLKQMGRRLAPYATEMGAAIGRTLPSVGAAGAGAVAAAPFLVWPTNTQSVGTIDLGNGLRTNLPPGQRYVPIERRVAPGVFGSDVGATWKPVPGLYGEVDPGRGVLVDPDRLREALGDEAANRILNTPGIIPMAKPPTDEQPPPPSGHNQEDKQPRPGDDQEPPKPPPPSLLPPLVAITGALSGTPAKIRPQDEEETVRGLTRENEAARFLADKGYNVEQRPKVPGNKNPDYRINGEVYDHYAPAKDTNVQNVATRIQRKVSSGQTERVVVNLADSSIPPEQLLEQLTSYPIPGLKSVIAISPESGAIMYWSFP